MAGRQYPGRRSLWIAAAALIAVLAGAIIGPPRGAGGAGLQATPLPEVYAEAVGQANLRSGPGIDYPVVGQIVSGTRYRVLARHALVPWYQLDFPVLSGEAWVYADLVTLTGNAAALPAVDGFAAASTPTPTTPPATNVTPTPAPSTATVAPTDPPAASPSPAAAALVTTIGEANVRYGPGVEYPTIARVAAGAQFPLLAIHSLVPWVQIALPESPDGTGWIFRDIIEISGDTSQVPVTNTIQFGVPELTPTPQTVIVSGAPWNGAPLPAGKLASTLGEAMHTYLLEQGFAPYTDRLASVFVLDLQTGDTFTLNEGVAFSGMSLTKIPILVTYFQQHHTPLSPDEAFLVADTMMCSENITTNDLLAQIGEGDALRGAQRVTALMQSLNLRGTFLMRPYELSPDEPPVVGISTIKTGADQTSTRPDAYNQILPRDLGWLLAGIYQCAAEQPGLLTERYPDDFTAQECRQMLYAMDSNVINVFLEAGIPPGARVIHKHGWISDTHGDAGIVIGPQAAYVIVVALYSRDWLEFKDSTPVIAELSRMAWNYFNPDTLVPTVREGTVPGECNPRVNAVLNALLSDSLPMIGPAAISSPGAPATENPQ